MKTYLNIDNYYIIMEKRAITKNEGTLISIYLLSMVAMFPICCIMFTVDVVMWIGFIFAGVSFLTMVMTTILFRKT